MNLLRWVVFVTLEISLVGYASSSTCQKLNSTLFTDCTKAGYNVTELNLSRTQKELSGLIATMRSKFKNCSSLSSLMTCSVQLPKCSTSAPKLPCKEACKNFVSECQNTSNENDGLVALFRGICELLPSEKCLPTPNNLTNSAFDAVKCTRLAIKQCQNAGYNFTSVSDAYQQMVAESSAIFQDSDANSTLRKIICMEIAPPCDAKNNQTLIVPCRSMCDDAFNESRSKFEKVFKARNYCSTFPEFPDNTTGDGKEYCTLKVWPDNGYWPSGLWASLATAGQQATISHMANKTTPVPTVNATTPTPTASATTPVPTVNATTPTPTSYTSKTVSTTNVTFSVSKVNESTPAPTLNGSTTVPSTKGTTPAFTPTGNTTVPSTNGTTPASTPAGNTTVPSTNGTTPASTPTGNTTVPSTNGTTPASTPTGNTTMPSTKGTTPAPTPTGNTTMPSTKGTTPASTPTGNTTMPSTKGTTPASTPTGNTTVPSTKGTTPASTPTGNTTMPSSKGTTPASTPSTMPSTKGTTPATTPKGSTTAPSTEPSTKRSTQAPTPHKSSTSSSSTSEMKGSSPTVVSARKGGKMSAGAIAGIVLGLLALVLAIVVGAICFRRYYRTKSQFRHSLMVDMDEL